jgi:integrase
MSRVSVVSYLRHRQSGKGRACWTDALGIPKQRLLPGPYGSRESRKAFDRLKLEVESSPAAVSDLDGITLVEILALHRDHAREHYRRPDGTMTHEVTEYEGLYKLLRKHYGDLQAAEFGPLALKAVRAVMVGKGWCRNLVNQRVGRVRRIFKWAAGEELIPIEVYHRLTAVRGLQLGRSQARESEPVGPVDEAVVDATLPHLNRHVAGLVQFQRLTGCRPGEAVAIRRRDIDTGGAVWLYRPAHHKLAYRGKPRVIAIGPKAQAVLCEFFTANLDDYLFSPRRAVEEFHAERAAKRKTPRFPSHIDVNRRKLAKRPRWTADERYTTQSYGRALARACDRAFPPPQPLARRKGETLSKRRNRLGEDGRKELAAWQSAHRWAPNQLRHTLATRVRKQHGLEAAQVLLGHSRADVTQIYAERNEALAVAVAAKIG